MGVRRVGGSTRSWDRWLVPGAAVVALLAAVALTLLAGLALTDGQFAYALDDAYIHMALAKNLVNHGVLGITPFEFTSASSSPAWTALLAAVFLVTGPQTAAAFVLAFASASIALVVADRVMVGLGIGWQGRLVGLLWTVFATPMTPIVFGGMEHPLQIAVDLAFTGLAAAVVAGDTEAFDARAAALCALSALAVAVRFEALAIVAAVAALLLIRRRWRTAVAVVGAAAMPIVATGVASVIQGGYFLPNSVLIKGATAGAGALMQGASPFVARLMGRIVPAYGVVAAGAAAAVLLGLSVATRRSVWTRTHVFALVAIVAGAAQFTLGDVGWFYRYEAYLFPLVGIALLGLARSLKSHGFALDTRTAVPVVLVTALLFASTFGTARRGYTAMRLVPAATHDIYAQQVQMARYIARNPQIRSVALNDVGAVAFYNDDLRILDLWGLGEQRPDITAMAAGTLGTAAIAGAARRKRTELAIVYPDRFDLPAEWEMIGTWDIGPTVTAAGSTVAVYAVPPTDPEELRPDFAAFCRDSLPDSVRSDIEAQASGPVR